MNSTHIKSDLKHEDQADLDQHHYHYAQDGEDEDKKVVIKCSPSSSSSTSTTAQNDGVKMAGRGKIYIRPIENPTNRQVSYSKRRSGIFKKANELSVLCDAKVSLILISYSSRSHCYISDNTTTKEMIDLYQQRMGIDVWEPQYERMKEMLKMEREKNNELRREIRRRMGYNLEDMSFSELRVLENSMSNAVQNIRSKKYHKIKSQTVTTKKRMQSHRERNFILMHNYQVNNDDIPYGLVEDLPLGFGSSTAVADGASNLHTFRFGQQIGSQSTTLHRGRGGGEVFDPYNAHDLRLS